MTAAGGLRFRRLIPRRFRLWGWRVLFRSATFISKLGSRFGVDWLVYNPLVFLWMHLGGTSLAPTVYASFQKLFPDARRYVDVGAGTATMAAFGRRLGLDVHACEHARVARWFARRQGVPCYEFDLTQPQQSPVGEDFDVAYSFEVGEHLPPSLSAPLVTFIISRARRIVFSAAQPGQGGHGHINEQPLSYWIDCFADAGCHYESAMTEDFRRHVSSVPDPVDWLTANVMIFTRSS